MHLEVERGREGKDRRRYMHSTMDDGRSHACAEYLDTSSAEGFRKDRKGNHDRYCRAATRLGAEESH